MDSKKKEQMHAAIDTISAAAHKQLDLGEPAIGPTIIMMYQKDENSMIYNVVMGQPQDIGRVISLVKDNPGSAQLGIALNASLMADGMETILEKSDNPVAAAQIIKEIFNMTKEQAEGLQNWAEDMRDKKIEKIFSSKKKKTYDA